MPADVGEMSPFFVLMLILYLPAAIYYSLKVYDRRKQQRSNKIRVAAATPERSSTLRIDQKEPSNRPPAILSAVSLICAFLLFIFGALVVYLWIAGKATFVLDIFTLFFLLLFIALPLYILIDNFIFQRRFYRIGKSSMAREAKVIRHGDNDAAFDTCRAILDAMDATMINAKRPNMLRAKRNKSIITIKIRRIKGSNISIYVLCDSQWLTTKFDMGANQRFIDNFLEELNRR